MLARAEVYNSRLSGALSMDPFRTGGADPSEEDEEYNALLNINGVMGYIDIPRLMFTCRFITAHRRRY